MRWRAWRQTGALARGFDQATDVSSTLSYRVAMVVPDNVLFEDKVGQRLVPHGPNDAATAVVHNSLAQRLATKQK